MQRKIYEMWTVLNYIVLYTITFPPPTSLKKRKPPVLCDDEKFRSNQDFWDNLRNY